MQQLDSAVSLDDLNRLFLFADVKSDILEQVARACPVFRLDEGETLIKRGQRNHSLYIILKGRLRIQLDKGDGTALSYIGEGRCVGEMSIIEEEDTSASVIADVACDVLEIEDQILWGLIEQSSVVAKNLLRLLSKRVRNDNHTISETKKLQQYYEEKSNFDTLTGLRNRRWLDEHFEQYASMNHPVCLLMIDIDHFKNYNDQFGHLAGDFAIASVAKVMSGNLRQEDIALRYGGEEFVAILHNSYLDYAHEVANRLLEHISKQIIIDQHGKPLPSVTVSIGMAQHSRGDSRETLITHADNALYAAKRAGRNQVKVV